MDTFAFDNEDALKALKLWLFTENVRIEEEKRKLLEMQNKFLHDKLQFQNEMQLLNHKIAVSQQRLKQDELFFEKKMEILKSGFAQLEEDRKSFQHKMQEEEARFRREKQEHRETASVHRTNLDTGFLFAGVRNSLALKKRYKDLLKIYHPDNLAGDKEMVQMINKEYERLKQLL